MVTYMKMWHLCFLLRPNREQKSYKVTSFTDKEFLDMILIF